MLCNAFNIYWLPFPVFVLTNTYVLFAMNMAFGNVEPSMRRAAVVDSVRGALAVGIFVLDGLHAFQFDYWHALWHLAAMVTLPQQSWLIAHIKLVASKQE